jgi:spoIIIJ-associated protein
MRSVEASAKTRQEAIKKALEMLGVELHEVDIEILDEGSKGFFGFGAREVKVRLSTDVLPDEPRPRRHERSQRNDRPERNERPERNDRPERNERPERQERSQKERREDRPRKDGQDREERKQPKPQQERQNRPAKPERPAAQQQNQRPHKQEKPQQQQRQKPVLEHREPKQETRHKEERPPREERRREETPAEPAQPISDARREEAAALLGELMQKMSIEATVSSQAMDDGGARINVDSPDSALLIGRKGKNLEALQYLINRMMTSSENDSSERFVIDIEHYLDRRRETLEDMARQLALKAKETGRDVRVKPLSPQERRIIHVTLQDDPDIRTFSIGTSSMRHVVISPKTAQREDGGSRRPPRGRGSRGRGVAHRRPQRGGQQGNEEAAEHSAPESAQDVERHDEQD